MIHGNPLDRRLAGTDDRPAYAVGDRVLVDGLPGEVLGEVLQIAAPEDVPQIEGAAREGCPSDPARVAGRPATSRRAQARGSGRVPSPFARTPFDAKCVYSAYLTLGFSPPALVGGSAILPLDVTYPA